MLRRGQVRPHRQDLVTQHRSDLTHSDGLLRLPSPCHVPWLGADGRRQAGHGG
jgi:hypothetical protein